MPQISEIRALAALSARNFRLYFFGQCVALTGTWMQRLAMSWLVLEITRSASRMGLVEFVNQAPVFILGLFIGVFLDRHDLRAVLITTQAVTIVHSFTMALLLHMGQLNYPAILLLSFLLGIITAVDMPARQASIAQMINHPSQLQSALSLQSGSFNLARLIGPAVAGFVVKAGGEVSCFLLNGIAHMFVLYAYCAMRLPQRELAPREQKRLSALREGLSYAMGVAPIRLNLIFTYAFNFFSMTYTIMLPLFAKEVLGGDSRHLGSLLGALGIGALVGVMYMAAKIHTRQLPRHFCRMQTGFGLVFIVFSFITDWRLSVALMPFMGFTVVSAAVASNSLMQSVVDENKRGRVMSLYMLGGLGFGPIGILIFGHIAEIAGPQNAALLCGLMAFLVGLLHYGKLRIYDTTVDPLLKTKGL